MNISKNNLTFLLAIISGIVIGGFIGNALGDYKYFEWLNYGKTMGITQPFVLDLDFLQLQFGFNIKFTISGIIGIVISILVYKKL